MNGTDRIREKINTANKTQQLARFMQDVGITQSQLEHFLAGRSNPPPDVLIKMAVYFWPNAKYDAANDILVAGNADVPPKPLCVGHPPPPARNPDWHKPTLDDLVQPASKPVASKKTRAGWLGALF